MNKSNLLIEVDNNEYLVINKDKSCEVDNCLETCNRCKDSSLNCLSCQTNNIWIEENVIKFF